MKCKKIPIQQLVPKEVYGLRKEQAWQLIDSRLIVSLDVLDETFPGIYINNWHVGGVLQNAGFRLPNAKGAVWSQHKYGRAADVHSTKASAQEIHAYILAHQSLFPHLTCLEEISATPTWVHIDCRNSTWTGIITVMP